MQVHGVSVATWCGAGLGVGGRWAPQRRGAGLQAGPIYMTNRRMIEVVMHVTWSGLVLLFLVRYLHDYSTIGHSHADL